MIVATCYENYIKKAPPIKEGLLTNLLNEMIIF